MISIFTTLTYFVFYKPCRTGWIGRIIEPIGTIDKYLIMLSFGALWGNDMIACHSVKDVVRGYSTCVNGEKVICYFFSVNQAKVKFLVNGNLRVNFIEELFHSITSVCTGLQRNEMRSSKQSKEYA